MKYTETIWDNKKPLIPVVQLPNWMKRRKQSSSSRVNMISPGCQREVLMKYPNHWILLH